MPLLLFGSSEEYSVWFGVIQYYHGQLIIRFGDRSNISVCFLLCLPDVMHCNQPFMQATSLDFASCCNCVQWGMSMLNLSFKHCETVIQTALYLTRNPNTIHCETHTVKYSYISNSRLNTIINECNSLHFHLCFHNRNLCKEESITPVLNKEFF